MNQDILVSIVVITYNSSNFIIEALESIKEQTYENIELIITDDASTDNTIDIVNHWIRNNQDRFSKVEIITNDINTGITPNLNRGIKACSGKFIKPIAGDDLLINTCIEHSLEYCIDNNYEVVYSRAALFTDPIDLKIEQKMILYDEIMYDIFSYDSVRQNKILHTGFHMRTIGLFFSRKLIEDMDYFNEDYKMMEDYPFAFKLTKMGYKLNLLDSYEVEYRVRTNSNSIEFKSSKRNINNENDIYYFQNNVLIPSMKKNKMLIQLIELYLRRISISIREGFDNRLVKLIGVFISYLSILKIKTRVRMIIIFIKSKISYIKG